MKHLIIIGVGGLARSVYEHAKNSLGYDLEWDIKGFLDGDIKLAEEEYEKLPAKLLGDINTYSIEEDDVFICAIAEPKIKEKMCSFIQQKDGKFINIIHKTAQIEGNIEMGTGNIVCPNVTLTANLKLGNFILFNIGCLAGHDTIIGDFSSFMAGAVICGSSQVGKRVYMATHAIALPHSRIEDDVYVGVASVVMKRVKANLKVYGNPAMPI